MTDRELVKLMKRMAHLLVLEILKAYTDEEHGLKVSQIVGLLEKDYGVTMERKAVSRILNDLLELSEIPEEYSWKRPMGFSIKYETTHRSTGDIRDGWRLCGEFETAELRLLYDLVLSVRGYPGGRLLEKLRRLGRGGMCKDFCGREFNSQMPVSIDAIERAIRKERKLAFDYSACRAESGQRGACVISPYKTVFRNGDYYLIGYDEEKGEVTHFLIWKIRNAVPLDSPAKDYHTVSSAAQWQYDFQQYLERYIPVCGAPEKKEARPV